MPAPTITSRRRGAPSPRAPRAAPTGSTRTAHAFSSGCLEIGSIARRGHGVQRAGARLQVQRAPVKRRERDARGDARRSPAARSVARAAARAHAHPLAVVDARPPRVVAGAPRRTARGSAASSAATCRCASSCATGGRRGRSSARAGSRRRRRRRARRAASAASRARPSGVGEAPAGVEPLGARGAVGARRARPLQRALALAAARARCRSGRTAGPRSVATYSAWTAAAVAPRERLAVARARGRRGRRSPSPGSASPGGSSAARTSADAPLGVRHRPVLLRPLRGGQDDVRERAGLGRVVGVLDDHELGAAQRRGEARRRRAARRPGWWRRSTRP